MAFLPAATESAIANGDTRTLSLYHAHTHESITATYLVNGQYDQAVLDKLNWFLRDWRREEATKMDPRLFDTVWEVYRESGSQQPIMVMSAYRSAQTNAMLRRRSRQVAEHSQHILGRAMDQHYMDVPMSRIRELGMRLQRGGVGFYPTAATPFVHLDVGGVRHWPRMSYDQLARLFPDGKTVHIPSNGQPLPGYEQARAELEARGDGEAIPTATELKSKGFFAWLFGGGGGDEQEDNEQAGVRSSRGGQRLADRGSTGSTADVGNYGSASRDAGTHSFFASQSPRVAFPSRPAPVQAPAYRPDVQVAAAPPPASPQPVSNPQQTLALAMRAGALNGALASGAASRPVPELPSRTVPPSAGDPTARVPSAPVPPRRPVELAALGPVAPMPPMRPSELARVQPHDAIRSFGPGSAGPDAIGALIGASANRLAHLPDVITQGGPPQRGAGLALGYATQPSGADLHGSAASTNIPLPVARPSALLSPHLDRSNFRSLTRPEATARTPTRSAFGAVIPPIRAAAGADLGTFVPVPSARPSSFQHRASDLGTEHFSAAPARARGTARAPENRAEAN